LQEGNGNKNFDIVITDFLMPGDTGFVLYEKIKNLNPSQKIFFISGSHEEQIRDKYKNACVLKKPYDLDELEKMINYVLSQND